MKLTSEQIYDVFFDEIGVVKGMKKSLPRQKNHYLCGNKIYIQTI